MKGLFISFEGAEGSGKSTAMRRVGATLEQRGLDVVYTREPGGSQLGGRLRTILLDARNKNLESRAELFLYLADRAQHVEEVIRPALARGALVFSDRFADSTIVYQGYGRGLPIQVLEQLNSIAVNGLQPDLTLVLDVDVSTGLKRANARNEREGKCVSEGRFEDESLAFHTRVREGFLALAARHSDRVKVIDASASEKAVAIAAGETVAALLRATGYTASL